MRPVLVPLSPDVHGGRAGGGSDLLARRRSKWASDPDPNLPGRARPRGRKRASTHVSPSLSLLIRSGRETHATVLHRPKAPRISRTPPGNDRRGRLRWFVRLAREQTCIDRTFRLHRSSGVPPCLVCFCPELLGCCLLLRQGADAAGLRFARRRHQRDHGRLDEVRPPWSAGRERVASALELPRGLPAQSRELLNAFRLASPLLRLAWTSCPKPPKPQFDAPSLGRRVPKIHV
jgi:hypothetical protein